MSKEYIEKEAAINAIEDTSCYLCKKYIRTKKCDCDCEIWRNKKMLHDIPAADVKPVPAGGIGEMSDGYHTFNGLYYQRMILFAALVKAYKDRAWKSYRHEDGELCFGGGWFIVGIDTPAGSYTYHYENKHFELFECKELPVGKHWDGHTEKDVTRLLKLEPADVKPVVRGEWVHRKVRHSLPMDCPPYYGEEYDRESHSCLEDEWHCSNCDYETDDIDKEWWNFCPNCGADMRKETNDER